MEDQPIREQSSPVSHQAPNDTPKGFHIDPFPEKIVAQEKPAQTDISTYQNIDISVDGSKVCF